MSVCVVHTVCVPRVIFKATDAQRELWVEAAHDERMTLSEWIRSKLDGSLTSQTVERPIEKRGGYQPQAKGPAPTKPPAPSGPTDRVFRPDFKGKR